MKKKITNYLLLLLFTPLLFSSCSKWLDVKPEDKTLEEDIFSHETNINKALNAIYNNLASEDLYGQQLSKSTVDVMAQYYNAAVTVASNTHRYSQVINFGYTTSENQAYFEKIWNSGYKSILSVNNFLSGLDKYDANLLPGRDSILKGESYALRAMLHFDLLRLFGPVYSIDSLKVSIPYKLNTDVALTSLLPANQVMTLIINDLKKAEGLLKADPIIKSGINETAVAGKDAFYSNRNRRMNYYAVLALQARVYLYRNNKVAAAAAAEKVISDASQWFTWKGEQAHIGVDGDRLFSSEVIFGLNDLNMYNSQRALFDPSLTNYLLLAPLKSPDVFKDIYESNGQDFRYIGLWEDFSASIAASKPFSKVFIKYKDVDSKTKSWRNFQPLVRMSELYYIMAEATESVSYLNTVRQHRGLEPLLSTVNVNDELLKEYRKEFIGEGQLFFYYKRKNKATVKGFNLNNLAMNATKYVVPLPLSESNQR